MLADIDYLSTSATSNPASLAAKMDDMSEVTEDIEVLKDDLLQSQQTHLQAVLDTLEAISVTQLYEEAWKTLKIYEVKTALGESPASAGYEDLEDLAAADESDYGPAVRHTWWYMPECDRYKLIDPQEEGFERNQLRNNQFSTQKNPFHLWPNPANETILVQTSEKQAGRWAITNISGMAVKTGNWPSGEQGLFLKVNDLVPGMYYFVLASDGGNTTAAKLTVIR